MRESGYAKLGTAQDGSGVAMPLAYSVRLVLLVFFSYANLTHGLWSGLIILENHTIDWQ